MPPPGTPQEHLIQIFTETLRAAGGQTTVATSLRDVLVVAGDDSNGPAWVAPQALAAFPGLESVLGERGMGTRLPVDAAAVRDAPLGITAARLAIAETGSVLLHEDDLPGRATSLMTHRLIVLCPVSALVPSLDEAAPVLREIARSGPSYATFVTGPSRTADIERELAVGVQGPGVLHVVFVADMTL